MPASAIFPVDPNIDPIQTRMPCIIQDPLTPANKMALFAAGTTQIGSGYGPIVYAQGMAYNPATPIVESVRTPTKFKHVLCTTAAATALWTPAGGKKFRIMGYVICPDAGLAAAGIQLITFLDQAAAITIAHQTYLPIAASIAHQVPIVVALPGNGYISAVADNVLNVTMTSNVTAGAVSIFVYGTEE